MTKITADHLGCGAFVYIRQSTADQLLHNLESRRRDGQGAAAGFRLHSHLVKWKRVVDGETPALK
jgi:hypothetical protein